LKMWYNLTNVTNANTTLDILKAIDKDMLGGTFAIMMLVSLGIILFINYGFKSPKEAFLMTGFFVSIIAGLMWLAGMIPFFIAVFALILPFIGLILFFVIS
jgi:hypothetical protein